MKYLFANWKMYLDFDESCVLAHQLLSHPYDASQVKVAIFPSAVALSELEKMFAGSSYLLGAQHCDAHPKGAYTGAIGPELVKNVGCIYVLVGHSEYRHLYGEHDREIHKQMELALGAGLIPVLCVGESKEDMEAGKRQYRLKKQLMDALQGIDIKDKDFMVAYEPVWAIGSGDACTPSDVEDVHGWIRKELSAYTNRSIPILYGGSVDAKNMLSYVSLPTVDGVLVGGASTTAESFFSLMEAMK